LIWAGLTPAFAGKAVTPPPHGRRDSSDAGALARSLYNAVSGHKFARAWDYFAKPPAKGFENFVRDYADRVFVDVFKGGMNSQGAAGSAYAPVAVAISYTDSKGYPEVRRCYGAVKARTGILWRGYGSQRDSCGSVVANYGAVYHLYEGPHQ
jgi:hypothetical protein